jgi:hypothetical protein
MNEWVLFDSGYFSGSEFVMFFQEFSHIDNGLGRKLTFIHLIHRMIFMEHIDNEMSDFLE